MVSSTKLQIRGCIFVCTHPHCIDWSAVKLVEFILEFSLQLLFELLEAVFAGKTILRDLENLQSGIGQCAPSLGTAIPTPLPWRGETPQQENQRNNKIITGKRTLWTFSPTWELSLYPRAVSCVAINIPPALQGCPAECSTKLELFQKSTVLGYPHSSPQTSPVSN